MKITYGAKGLTNTWQNEFPKEVKCHRLFCRGKCRPAINIMEDQESKECAFHLHDNDPQGGGYWLHDGVAFQIYLCKKCLQPTTLYNQG
jgi:hypothetical protein